MKISLKKKVPIAILCIIASILLICAIMLGWLYAQSGAIDRAKHEIQTPAFRVCAISEDGNAIDVNSWYNDKDGKEYIFLPSDAVADNLTVIKNDETQQEGSIKRSDKNSDEYTVTFNGNDYDTVILQGSDIPCVRITTDSMGLEELYADKSNKDKAHIDIFDGGEMIVSERLKSIKGRGNASWDWPQKSFNIKFKNKIDLFNMGGAKKYSLITSYTDPTLIKDYLTYSLADDIKLEYSPDSVVIDLYVNNDYLGVYLLSDSIGAGSGRVDINDLDDANELANPGTAIDELPLSTNASSIDKAENATCKWVDIANEPDDITNGYILELEFKYRYINEPSGFVTQNGQAVVLKSPEYATQGEINYISSLYQEFEDALYSQDGINASGKHYSDYIDVTSFAKMYLVQELTQNRDANDTSTYMYLDESGVLKAGPVWDFDNALGNQVFLGNMNDPDTVKADELQVCYKGFFRELYKHDDFRAAVYNEWSTNMRDEVLDILTFADESCSRLSESAVMNGIRYNRYNTVDSEENIKKYNAVIEDLKNFINTRIELFDDTFKENSAVLFYNANAQVSEYEYGDSVSVGDKLVISGNMYKSNKKFLGWNTNADGSGEAYSEGDEITLEGDSVMLYAQWSDSDSTVLTIKNKISDMYTKVSNSLKYRICEIMG